MFDVHHRWGTIQDRALFKRGNYSRWGTIQDRALFKRGHYSREGTIFYQCWYSCVVQHKQRKTEPKVYCKLSRLNRKGNKNCDFDPENTSAMIRPKTSAKEHQTCTYTWFQAGGGGGGGGTIQERALFFHWLLETGALLDRGL